MPAQAVVSVGKGTPPPLTAEVVGSHEVTFLLPRLGENVSIGSRSGVPAIGLGVEDEEEAGWAMIERGAKILNI